MATTTHEHRASYTLDAQGVHDHMKDTVGILQARMLTAVRDAAAEGREFTPAEAAIESDLLDVEAALAVLTTVRRPK